MSNAIRLSFLFLLTILPVQAAAQQAELTDLSGRAALEAFMDGIIAAQLKAHDVPGATLSIVKDGEVLLAKGYGWADAARTRPVDPRRTLFRPGSVAKLFTWTAVMQLAEQGKLDLDRDVNEYLTQFKIPEKYGKPVTLRHLMTHTPGFEDGALGFLFSDDETELVPLAESLAAHMPARVRPPGTHAAYSNWGTALAGLIVANVSGMDYETYIERNILQPLGMNNSTFREPLPDELAPDMSEGLKRETGLFKDQGFEFVSNFGPAGALSSTAADMANFMIAHLQDGRFADQRILSATTAQQMHARAFGHDDRIPGMALGFYEMQVNGRRLIAHGGDTLWFHTNLILLPEEGLGLYVSFNAPAGASARSELVQVFMDRYFPAPEPETIDPPGDFSERAAEYAGAYRANRRSYTKFERIFGLGGDLIIGVTDENRLLLSGSEPRQLVEVGKDLFRVADGEDRFAFRRGEGGKVTHLYGLFPALAFDKLEWWETAQLHQLILGLGLAVFAGVVAGTLWGGRKWFAMARGEKIARLTVFAASTLYLAFVTGLAVLLVPHGIKIVFNYPPGIEIVLGLSVAAAALTAFALLMMFRAWAGGYWSVFGRLRYTFVVLILTAFTLSLWYWNAIGWWNL
jgi:CubicO group peptidase (beta-lactamase class C family)